MTAAAQIAARATAVRDPYVALVEIVTPGLTLWLTDDLAPVSYGGVAYQPWPVRVTFGATGPDRQPGITLEVSNVSQAVASALRPLAATPTCNIRVARLAKGEYVTFEGEQVTWGGEPITFGGPADTYNVQAIESTWPPFAIDDVEFTAATAACRLGMEWNFSRETFPFLRHDGRFRGLWA